MTGISSVTMENAEIKMKDNGVLKMVMLPRANIDIESAKKIAQAASEISGSTIHANLVDIRKMTFMSSEARKYFGSQDKSNIPAVAILMDSRLQKALVNLYLKITSPKTPTKVFDKEKEAEAWLVERIREAVRTN